MRVPVRVKPNAKKDAVGGLRDGPWGAALIVAVTAPASGGRANESVRAVLAGALGVRAREVTIVSGQRARDKLVEVADPHGEVAERLAELY
ncbi:DUF167 domain-containing protein [Haloechinothrix sp. LS1_15]|nr:DUF167 domain-containing protein [Haloechinothrix sp. LS1_15]